MDGYSGFMRVVLPMSDHYRFTVEAHAHIDFKFEIRQPLLFSTQQAGFLAAKCLQRIQSIFDGGLCGPISPNILVREV